MHCTVFASIVGVPCLVHINTPLEVLVVRRKLYNWFFSHLHTSAESHHKVLISTHKVQRTHSALTPSQWPTSPLSTSAPSCASKAQSSINPPLLPSFQQLLPLTPPLSTTVSFSSPALVSHPNNSLPTFPWPPPYFHSLTSTNVQN